MPNAKDYSSTKLYYIPVGDKKYFGHTTCKNLATYQSNHRSAYKKAIQSGKLSRKLHKELWNADMKPHDIVCVLVEEMTLNNAKEAKQRERYWIETLKAQLNMICPILQSHEVQNYTKQYNSNYYQKHRDTIVANVKAYVEQNKEQVLQRKKEYYKKKKDSILQSQAIRTPCPHCNKVMRKSNILRHIKQIHTEV